MRPPFLNLLKPWGWTAAGLAALAVLVLAAGAAGLRWDPFGLTQRRLDRAQAELAVARADASARRIEQAAQVGQRARLDAHHHTTTAAADLAVAVQAQAREAADAQTPLDTDRADRLRRLDRGLCSLAADLAGCAATSGAAR